MSENKNNAEDTTPILVAFAEDHLAVRKGIIAFIEKLGGLKIIIETSNGKALIEHIEKSNPLPDVCIIDIQMPVMNGFETVSILKSKWPQINVLILTAIIEELHAIRMIKLGANGYLLKNCRPEEIKQAVTAIHENGVYFNDFFAQKLFAAVQSKTVKLPHLSEMETRILKYTCTELTYGQIAKEMKTTITKVEGYRDNLHKKLGVKSRVGLALFAIRSGIVTMENGANPFIDY